MKPKHAPFVNGVFILTGEKAFMPIADRAETILVYAAGEDASTEAFLVASDNPAHRFALAARLLARATQVTPISQMPRSGTTCYNPARDARTPAVKTVRSCRPLYPGLTAR